MGEHYDDYTHDDDDDDDNDDDDDDDDIMRQLFRINVTNQTLLTGIAVRKPPWPNFWMPNWQVPTSIVGSNCI